MKKNIHPDYHPITIIMTDGTSFETRSTWGKANSVYHLEIDVLTHHVWTKEKRNVETKGSVSKFNKRFQGIDM